MSSPAPVKSVVAIDALSAVSGGGLSVARGLSASLAAVRPKWQILMIASHEDALPSNAPANIDCLLLPLAQSGAKRWVFEQRSLPRILSERGVDAVLLLGGYKIFASDRPQAAIWQNAHIWTPPAETHTLKLTAYIALQRLIMRATASRVAKNIFLSADSAIRCRQSIEIPDASLEIAPIGVDEVFLGQPPPTESSRREPVLLAVGDVYTHKRFELAIEALTRLATRFPNLELWIAGRILDPPYHARLIDQINRGQLRDRVQFLGHVPRERLIEIYRSSTVFVASSCLETFGLTPIEAMACGLPVVACAESAVPEVCGDGAEYAPESTGAALARVIDRILANPEEWSALQRRGIERSRSFAWPIVAERYAALLESLIGRESPVDAIARSESAPAQRY